MERRTLVKGAAWSVPAVVAGATAPAMAASACTPAAKEAIDVAFRKVTAEPNYAFWIAQGGGLTNSTPSAVYLYGQNLSAEYDVTFSPDDPVEMTVYMQRMDGQSIQHEMGGASQWGAVTANRQRVMFKGVESRVTKWVIDGVQGSSKAIGKGGFFHLVVNSPVNPSKVYYEINNLPFAVPTLESIARVSGVSIDSNACAYYWRNWVLKLKEQRQNGNAKVAYINGLLTGGYDARTPDNRLPHKAIFLDNWQINRGWVGTATAIGTGDVIDSTETGNYGLGQPPATNRVALVGDRGRERDGIF